MTKRIFAAACAALASAGSVAAPFKDGDTVVFYGDSITHSGTYHSYIWEYYLTRRPEAKITFFNAGIAGDDTKRAQPRFGRDVAARKPTAISVMFGMNDVRINLYGSTQTDKVVEGRKAAIAAFRDNIAKIDELASKAGIGQVYRLTPTPFDDTSTMKSATKAGHTGANAGLGRMAEAVRERAETNGGTLVDLYTALNAYNRRRQAEDPSFTIVGPDRVHPMEPGHFLMAYTFLKAQGADPLVSDIGLDYARREVEKSVGAAVSEVQWGDDAIGFTVLERSLPMPVPAAAGRLLDDFPIVQDLNQEVLQVRSLPRGSWALEIDGTTVGEWKHDEWERGVNLAMNEKTPQYAQAQKVHKAVMQRRALENKIVGWKACKWWLDINHVDSDDWKAVDEFWNAKPGRKGYFEALFPDFRANWDRRGEQERKVEDATEACRAAARPVAHRYRVVRGNDGKRGDTKPWSKAEPKAASPVDFPFESTVVVRGTQTTSEFAVKELNAIVRKATGREFEVRTTGNLADCAGKKKIFVGRGPELDELLVGSWIDETYGEEESVVMDKDGSLCLFGKDELGSLWAVYDFCEDSLGYRWFLNRKEDDGGEAVAKTDIVRWNGVSTRRQPKFHGSRRIHSGIRPETGSWLFRVRNRDNSAVHEVCPEYRWKYQVWTRGHGFNMYLPPGKITYNIEWCIPKGAKIKPNNFKEHPEWFSLMKDGKRSDDHQLCLSNPGCRKALIEAVCEYVRVCGKGVYMVGENDARFGRYCHCDGCIALEKKYNTTGGPMWDFVVEACNAVKARFGEGVYLTTLAYDGLDQTEKAPDNIVFPDNFIVDIAYIHCPDRSIRRLPDKRAPEGEMVNYWQNTLKWCRIAKQRSYWFYGTMSPCLVYRRMTDEMRELYEAGIQSPGACGTGGGYEFYDFTPYLYYKLLQDPYCDIRSHLEEALNFKYGKAAPFVLKYIDSLENAFIEYLKGCGGRVFETDRPYENLGFVTGRQIAEWRGIFDAAEPLVKDSPVHAANLMQAKIGLNIMTVLFEKRVRKDAPSCAFDRAAALAESRAAAEDYGKRYIWRRPNYALQILEQAESEMAYYGDLKTERLPPEFDGMQPQFITRILPYKSVPIRNDKSGRMTSEPDPQAICGYAVVDRWFDSRDVSKGVRVYVWDFGAAVQHPLKTIPLSAFKKDRYSLVKLGTTVLSSDCSLIFAEGWSSPLSQRFLPRAFNPSYPKRKYEIWASLKAEGPKFFQGDTRENRLYMEQLFAVEIVGS